jgi:imidazoleglycerol phosphate dehydratase HisB
MAVMIVDLRLLDMAECNTKIMISYNGKHAHQCSNSRIYIGLVLNPIASSPKHIRRMKSASLPRLGAHRESATQISNRLFNRFKLIFPYDDTGTKKMWATMHGLTIMSFS